MSSWSNYLLHENLQIDGLTSTPLGERLFYIVQETPTNPLLPDFKIPVACASHDIWTLSYLPAFAASFPAAQEAIVIGVDLLRGHPGWHSGELRDLRCGLLGGIQNFDTASFMYPVLEQQVARGGGSRPAAIQRSRVSGEIDSSKQSLSAST